MASAKSNGRASVVPNSASRASSPGKGYIAIVLSPISPSTFGTSVDYRACNEGGDEGLDGSRTPDESASPQPPKSPSVHRARWAILYKSPSHSATAKHGVSDER